MSDHPVEEASPPEVREFMKALQVRTAFIDEGHAWHGSPV
jgi:hypothetical protein